MLDMRGATAFSGPQDEAVLTRYYRRRALQNLSEMDNGSPTADAQGFESGQEAILAIMDWSLSVAGRWHWWATSSSAYGGAGKSNDGRH